MAGREEESGDDDEYDEEDLAYVLNKSTSAENRMSEALRSLCQGRSGLVKRALELGALEASASHPDGETLVHAAAAAGKVGLLRSLVGKGADVNRRDAQGETPLHTAIGSHHDRAALLLIEAPNCDLNVTERINGQTPLMLAAGERRFEVVKALAAKGADLNAVDYQGKTALETAVEYGEVETIKALVAGGAGANGLTSEGQTLLELAVEGGDVETIKALVAGGADANGLTSEGQMLLELAVLSGNVDVVKALVAGGADVHAVNNEGKTALEIALADGQEECALELQKAVLANGGNVDAVDAMGKTALETAIEGGREDHALYLLQKAGASWRGRMRVDGEDLNLMEAAARLDRARVVKGVVQRMRADGVDAETMARSLDSAAFHASIGGARNARRALVEEGLEVKSMHYENEGAGQRTASKRKREE